jgi:bifunctional non-homologous end joining protein LigD
VRAHAIFWRSTCRPDLAHEIKHDGYRLIVRRDGDAVRLFTRPGHDWTERYPAIARAAAKLRAESFTLDGEAVVCGPDGVAMFDALHRRGTVAEAMLYAFDLLELDGADLRALPLGERKTKLAKLLARAPAALIFNEHTEENGATVFRHACQRLDQGQEPRQPGDGAALVALPMPPPEPTIEQRRTLRLLAYRSAAHHPPGLSGSGMARALSASVVRKCILCKKTASFSLVASS